MHESGDRVLTLKEVAARLKRSPQSVSLGWRKGRYPFMLKDGAHLVGESRTACDVGSKLDKLLSRLGIVSRSYPDALVGRSACRPIPVYGRPQNLRDLLWRMTPVSPFC